MWKWSSAARALASWLAAARPGKRRMCGIDREREDRTTAGEPVDQASAERRYVGRWQGDVEDLRTRVGAPASRAKVDRSRGN